MHIRGGEENNLHGWEVRSSLPCTSINALAVLKKVYPKINGTTGSGYHSPLPQNLLEREGSNLTKDAHLRLCRGSGAIDRSQSAKHQLGSGESEKFPMKSKLKGMTTGFLSHGLIGVGRLLYCPLGSTPYPRLYGIVSNDSDCGLVVVCMGGNRWSDLVLPSVGGRYPEFLGSKFAAAAAITYSCDTGAGTGRCLLAKVSSSHNVFNSATSGDTPEVEALVLTLETMALLWELRTLTALDDALSNQRPFFQKVATTSAEFKRS
ncbi:hypothetical protein Tco_0738884 [Tanacetum coccineum]